MKSTMYALGLVVLTMSVQASVAAIAPVAAPEIDGGTLVSGLGLLSGAAMIVRARMRR